MLPLAGMYECEIPVLEMPTDVEVPTSRGQTTSQYLID